MGFTHISNDVEPLVLTNAAISGSVSSTAVDTINIASDVGILINVRASGTGTSVPVLEHSDASGSGFEAVPADGIVDLDTGDPTALSSLTTAASTQTRSIRRDYLRRYLRLSYSGGTTHNVAAFAFGVKKYTEE